VVAATDAVEARPLSLERLAQQLAGPELLVCAEVQVARCHAALFTRLRQGQARVGQGRGS